MTFKIKIFVCTYLFLLVVMFILPFYSAEGYSMLSNTTSQLGAQLTPNSWIMNVAFVLMGATSILAGWNYYQGYGFHQLLLLVFGGSLACTAIFSHAPINLNLDYDLREDQMHSWFATSTGFAFTILAIATAFIKAKKIQAILPLGIGIYATLLSILMFAVADFMGLWQRLLFISSFGWMIYEFSLKEST